MSNKCDKCDEHCLDCHCRKDMVKHPTHYQGKQFEVIDIIEDFGLGFCLGNAIKYILRAGKKENREKDLRKAIWYLERELINE